MINHSARSQTGFSMIELLIGVTIFGLAMVPLMWMSTKTTSGTYSVGKHMMAGQIAASMLDRLIALPYDECCKEAKKMQGNGKSKVMSDEDFTNILKLVKNKGVEKDMKRSFKHFQYKIILTPNLKTKTARIDVSVFYRVREGSEKSEQSLKLSVLKFGVKNG